MLRPAPPRKAVDIPSIWLVLQSSNPIPPYFRLTHYLVCVAYECLRIINYLSHSTIIDIQTLLVLGDVLSNSMNAGVAWSFLGKWRYSIFSDAAGKLTTARSHDQTGTKPWSESAFPTFSFVYHDVT
jgi:hypothetical protein